LPTFQTSEEVAEIIGRFLQEIMLDPDLGPKFAAADAKVLITYTKPDLRLLLDCTANPPTVDIDPTDIGEAEFKLNMSADDGHKFWLGKLNVPMALAKRQVKVDGPLTKMMGLLPAIQPAHARYEAFLQANGHEDRVG
jgi:hypothetical protein